MRGRYGAVSASVLSAFLLTAVVDAVSAEVAHAEDGFVVPPSASVPPGAYGRYGPAVYVAPATPWTCGVPERRGPIEVREEWTLAAVRLTLPATSPDPLCCGETRVRVGWNRGSDFAIVGVTADRVDVDRWIVDSEHQTVDLGVRHGLRPDLDVGVRLPIRWRGGGFMDKEIADFHDFWALPDNGRGQFSEDAYDVRLRDEDGVLQHWEEDGFGLGNVELEAHWNFLPRRSPCGWSAALVGRVSLPTATEPFVTDSVDVGLQLVAAKQVAHRLDAYMGVGATVYGDALFGDGKVDGVEYQPVMGHAFGVLEWRLGSRLSLLVELSGATQLLANIPSYPWIHAYLNAGIKWQLARRFTFELGFTEGLVNQQAAVDFGLFAGLVASL